MKRIFSFILCILCLLLISISPAKADDGEGNINGGGGGMGSGTAQNVWHNGDDGVRVTVIRTSDNAPVSTPFDMTNRDESDVEFFFSLKSKLSYRDGSSLTLEAGNYSWITPEQALPTIITGDSSNNIPAIKAYFCSSVTAKKIADIVGCDYDQLVNGTYKLLLEPVAYFTFNGHKWAMTATEAAKYDLTISGGLRSKMVSLSHQNLPLSMFLQTSDMGYPAYEGSTSRPQSDTIIINELGLGIVKYAGDDSDGGGDNPSGYDATYRTDTDVITAVTLSTNSQIDPDSPAKVTFHILGSFYTRTSIVIPEGESQLVWVKWHTPSTPQAITITVSTNKGSLSDTSISADIASVTENTPPNPTATDRNDSFQVPDAPNANTSASNSWSVWSAEWIPNWVWQEDWVWVDNPAWPSGGEWEDHGQWVDDGFWQYDNTTYRATLTSNMDLEPDGKDPTAQGKKMRSGYGVDINVTSDINTNSSLSDVTPGQTAITYFPEFAYSKYWRVLDPTISRFSSTFAFKTNPYSTYGDRVHFTPVWYPDGPYTAYSVLEDAWTPAGMLTAQLTDTTTIDGSVFDDYHVGPKLVT